MKNLNLKQKGIGKLLKSCFYVLVGFTILFSLQSCSEISQTQNEFKVRDVKVRLSEYFTIQYNSWGWWIEIPLELELPEKVKVDGLATVDCMKRTYEIKCYDTKCKPYTIKGYSIDDGKFDMKSRWYKICTQAAGSAKQMR